MLPTVYALKIKLLYRRVLHKREFKIICVNKCKAIIKSITVFGVSCLFCCTLDYL